MEQADRDEYIRRYNERLKKYGYSPETLGWGKTGRQNLRYKVLSEYALQQPSSSVLDVGCGFGDLKIYLEENGWKGKYTGLDINDSLLDIARKEQPGIEVLEADIATWKNSGLYDFVIASGIFNAKLPASDNKQHIQETLKAMFQRTKKVLSVDFMSTYVDYQKEDAWHTDPQWILTEVQKLSKRFILRYDYMPYEFAIVIFKNDSIEETNVFNKNY